VTQPPGRAFPARTIAVMIVLGYLPLLHAASVAVLCVLPLIGKTPLWTLALAPGVLYLVPPLAVRLAVLVHPLPNGRCEIGSADFLVWWLTAQWQILFTRLPALEELLRLVPGLYSLWLRLWGARIGKLVYWSPGVLLFDRPLVHIGDRVLLGSCLRIVPHFIGPDEEGKRSLVIAPVRIGSDAIVGGHAVISPGVEIAPGAVTIATRSVRPFAVIKGPETA
jgi:hypothetical protein